MPAPTASAFRRHRAQTRRLYAFVHIANIRLASSPLPALQHRFAQTDSAARAVAENADMVLGAKVRMSDNVIAKHGLEPLKRAISMRAGGHRQGVCHIGGVERAR
jgi:dihydroorotase